MRTIQKLQRRERHDLKSNCFTLFPLSVLPVRVAISIISEFRVLFDKMLLILKVKGIEFKQPRLFLLT